MDGLCLPHASALPVSSSGWWLIYPLMSFVVRWWAHEWMGLLSSVSLCSKLIKPKEEFGGNSVCNWSVSNTHDSLDLGLVWEGGGGVWCRLQVVFQSLSCVRFFATPWTTALQASLSFTISWSLLKLMSIESVMPSNHLILCCSLFLLPSIFPSIRVYSDESVLNWWPEFWSFSFSISPSNDYSGLIYFRIDWFDLLSVQGTLKSLLQHHSSKASILWWSAFFIVQLSHPYMTTGKATTLTRWTFVSKVLSLLFNMLGRFVIAFLPVTKHLWISWLQSLSTVILEPRKRKSATVSIVSLSICNEVMGLDAMIFIFWMLRFISVFTLLFHPHQEAS